MTPTTRPARGPWRPGWAALLLILGLASLLPYLAALGLADLREHTVPFVAAYLCAFILYLAACAVSLRAPAGRLGLGLIFGFAILFRLIVLPTPPTLSDDMYRYVWDGRVQGHGVSPYRFPPRAVELAALRPTAPPVYQTVWRHINRKDAVTVYPPGAQLIFAGLWRVVGDSVLGFKAAFVLAELLGAGAVLGLLRALGLPLERVVIYLWSPLLVFEVAHAGHVDALMLPLLIAAFWARVRERPLWLGGLLAAATLVKLFPVLLLPALMPLPAHRAGGAPRLRASAQMLGALGITLALGYLPYLAGHPGGALGFLPRYFDENFNLGLARWVFNLAEALGWPRATTANAVTYSGLVALGLLFVLRQAATGHAALKRCLWLIGWFTLTTQNLFPWYLLWLLPLLTVSLAPGRWLGFQRSPGLAWLVFTGTVAFSYMFFIQWRVIPWAQVLEYAPLYGLLAAAAWGGRRPAERQEHHVGLIV